MYKRVWGLLIIVLAPVLGCAQAVVDATSLNNKVMAGYQGWFRTPGDRADNQGWSHLFNNNLSRPGFDMWPDMREYAVGEKTAVPGFTNPDGSQAYLYSAQNPNVVLRHFQWMKQYGIDGVWLSEFCDHFAGGRQEYDTTTVLTVMRNVRAAATATGRTWAFMWDMSGFGPQTSRSDVYSIIVNQWKRMVDEGDVTDPRYLHHDGKPVLLIWGFFPDRPASQPDYMNPVIDFLLAPGKYQATLVAGADDKWREGTPSFQAMLMRMTALQPWSVGRRVKDPLTGYQVPNTSKWADDMAKCAANHVLFIPVFNAGTNIAGPPPIPPRQPTVPRRTGNYLWEQFVAASRTGVINSAFVAMFDEINEGTQIMKTTNHPPTQFPFLTFDGATSDYYLRLVGSGAKMLRTRSAIPAVIPISPFDPDTWYTLQNRASGLALGSDTWRLAYDGKGYFTLRGKHSGRLLRGPIAGAVGKSADALWWLEWDGTGNCRIINKASGMALNGQGVPVADAKDSDDLRWRVEEPM